MPVNWHQDDAKLGGSLGLSSKVQNHANGSKKIILDVSSLKCILQK